MSDDIGKAIADKLDGVEPGSSQEMALSAQLAKELGFDTDPTTAPTAEQNEMLDILDPAKPPAEEAPAESVETPAEPEQKWEYTTTSGEVKSFDNEADKLRYQIGADANKWAEKFRALEAKVDQGGQPKETPPSQPVDPKTLLFEPKLLENEEWKASGMFDVITTAFEKYHALSVQDQDTRFKGLTDKFETLNGQVGESAVRSEFGISRSDEAKILEQQPSNVQEILTGMDPAARLAMIKQLGGKTEAVEQTPSPLPRAVSPQQAHVESSARGEPDRNPEDIFFEKFEKASDKEQLGLLGQLWKGSNSVL